MKMKKKLTSMLLALVMLLTVLPFEALAAQPLTETGGETSGEASGGSSESTPGDSTGETPGDSSGDAGGSGAAPTPVAGPLTAAKADEVLRYPHLTSGEIDFSEYVVPDAGPYLFTKNKVESSDSVTVASWTVTDEGVLKYSLSKTAEGGTIAFFVDVESALHGKATLEIPVRLDYEMLTITSPTSVAMGSTLRLTCAKLSGTGSVMYTVESNKDVVSINGNVLTPLKVGTARIKATQAMSDTGASQISAEVVITVVKGTPTGAPSFTRLDRAGRTLADTQLTKGSFSLPGTIEWVLHDSTVVIANTAYEWRFTPDDTDNFNAVTGVVTPYVKTDNDFAIGSGTTELNKDGSYTTISFGEDDSSYKLTEYPDGSMRMVHTLMDGTVTTTTKDKYGTRTQTVEYPDGSSRTTATDVSGIAHTTIVDKYGYASVQVYLPYTTTANAAATGKVIDLPIPEIPRTDDRADAPTITFTLAATSPVRVGIPINSPGPGTVAATVAKNGRETIVRTSTTGKDVIYVTISGSTTLKVFDNSKAFRDVNRLHWFSDAADFVTSRGLFQGMDAITFAPTETMSRAMLVTVLHNLEGNPYYSSYYNRLSDVSDTWYETAASWAIANGHISGFPDGTFRGDKAITREQLAVILYRYAGYPSVSGYVNSTLTDYLDYTSISPYAYQAMYWAVSSGVLYTSGRDDLAPQRPATRAEVAQTMQNLVEFLAG